ncbi:unnamed protein product [Schistosoma margrebowiei]|uniref:Uncharacterized protein n=1 Tax=Schistosoma margrebowiei TaxID=48269 RepID=A0A183MYP2_9TREM|nr:unnamed protein product [Schistosoma margrebowiei]
MEDLPHQESSDLLLITSDVKPWRVCNREDSLALQTDLTRHQSWEDNEGRTLDMLCCCATNNQTISKQNVPITPELSDLSHNKRKALYTPYWAVEIKGGEKAARAIAEKYGFLYLGEILPGIYHFKHNRISKRSLRQNNYYHDQLANDEQVGLILVF